jgi:ankyrin repeat protein
MSVQELIICSTDNDSSTLPAPLCFTYFNNMTDEQHAKQLDQHAGLAYTFEIKPEQLKYKVITRLLALNVDINKPSAIDDLPPLHAAILLHDPKLVQYLLEQGADKSIYDNTEKMTSYQLVDHLLERKATAELLAIKQLLAG